MSNFYPRLKSQSRFACRLVLTVLASLFLTTSQAQFGSFLSYDGTDDYVTLPANLVTGVTGSFTIEAYIYYRGGVAPFQRIIDLGTDQNSWIALTTNSNVAFTGPRFAINNGGTVEAIDAGSTLPQNAWTHLAVTLDNTTGVVNMYINGALSSTGTFSLRLSSIGTMPVNRIGQSKYPGDPYLNADLDEFRISNTVRYTGAFTPPMMEFASDANTVALFHFNEGSGQTTADASGNFSAATLGSNPAAIDANDPSWMSTLAVKLTDFSASEEGKRVALKWTASLDNATEFVIERSKDGLRFSQAGQVNANQATGGSQTFSFTDNSPYEGRSYYRLKCVEAGEAPVYSKILPVNFLNAGSLVIYPNPVKGNLITVETAKAVSGNVELKMYNSAGSLVATQKWQVRNQKLFTVNRNSPLAAGNYTIELIVDGKRSSKAIVMQ